MVGINERVTGTEIGRVTAGSGRLYWQGHI